jgi:Tol biopolymer transport system component
VVAWSPDSQLVAYGSLIGEPFSLNVASPSGLASARALSVSGGYVGELAWSPDGRYLGISTYTMDRKNHTTFIFDRASGTVRRLIDGCHITWAPDSKYVAVHRDPSPEPGTWVVAVDGSQRYALSADPTSYPELWEAS